MLKHWRHNGLLDKEFKIRYTKKYKNRIKTHHYKKLMKIKEDRGKRQESYKVHIKYLTKW